MTQRKQIRLGTNEASGSIPDLAQWVKELALPELWCRSQTQLASRVAVVAVT